MKNKIYRCKHCGNIITKINDSGVSVYCCGEEMEELVANSSDAASEKHIPIVEINDNIAKIKVGENPHPMLEEHYIEWIYIETKKGFQVKYLEPNQESYCSISIIDDEIEGVYSYCNLHGLWGKKIN